MRYSRRAFLSAVALGAAGLEVGCRFNSNANEVVVYAALDREFSEPILKRFERQSGIRVLAKYDVESTKTVGLVNAIRQEASRPRCDVFWNNEVLHTLRLEQEELLDPYKSPAAAGFPKEYRSTEGLWHGFAARARTFIVNTQLVALDELPRSIVDLADPKWKGRVGIAKPLFGTTATHAAVLYADWGQESASEFFTKIKENAKVMSGNKQVATAVGSGQIQFGLTDTDDAVIEDDHGSTVQLVYPDQDPGHIGTMLIPNSICIIRRCPHPDAARKLVDFLLSPEVESTLAEGESSQIPLNPRVQAKPRCLPDEEVHWMEVDFAAAARSWDTASKSLAKIFHEIG